MVDAVIVESDSAPVSAVSWPAIVAGGFVAAAITLLLLALGAGAGACQGDTLGQNQVAAMIGYVLETFTVPPGPTRGSLLGNPILRQFDTLPLLLSAPSPPTPPSGTGISGPT